MLTGKYYTLLICRYWTESYYIYDKQVMFDFSLRQQLIIPEASGTHYDILFIYLFKSPLSIPPTACFLFTIFLQ